MCHVSCEGRENKLTHPLQARNTTISAFSSSEKEDDGEGTEFSKKSRRRGFLDTPSYWDPQAPVQVKRACQIPPVLKSF
jgi:hypothetical protein